MNKEDIEELKREIRFLKQANIEYKDRIDKAIERLNKLDFDKFVYSKTGLKDAKRDLLEILKGCNDE